MSKPIIAVFGATGNLTEQDRQDIVAFLERL
jgi:hypothetical protein